ncbi:MAG TPA: hypothetical protein VH575_02400 [Gemmataceae bacterium]|jgi:hypothetical protein
MSTEPTIEQRLAALEAAVKEIQDRLGPSPSAERWWEKIPPVEDIEAFDEMLEYGRAYRYADRPPDEPGEQP